LADEYNKKALVAENAAGAFLWCKGGGEIKR
jgi:hypothetical protein